MHVSTGTCTTSLSELVVAAAGTVLLALPSLAVDPLVVSMTAVDRLEIATQALPASQLKAILQRHIRNRGDGTILFATHDDVPYHAVMNVLNTIRESGGNDIRFVTDSLESPIPVTPFRTRQGPEANDVHVLLLSDGTFHIDHSWYPDAAVGITIRELTSRPTGGSIVLETENDNCYEVGKALKLIADAGNRWRIALISPSSPSQEARPESIAPRSGNEPMRVGGEVMEPIEVSRVDAFYPEAARKARIDGIVVLEAIISKDGSVHSSRVLRGVHPLIDRSAMRAVQQWQYKPAMYLGRPVSVYLKLNVPFTLPSE